MCDDTTSNIDLSISSTDSTDSLLHFTTSAIYNKERKEVDLSESQGLANDDTTRDLVSRIQDLDLTCLREAVEHQKMRVETEEHEESAEDEDAEWTRSNPYDPQLYEAAESQGDSGSEEEQHHYVSPPTNRGCMVPFISPLVISVIHHKPRPTQLKKHDPVSSFHKHNDRWKKDPFLSRVDRARTAPSGGHGFVLNRGSSAGGARGVSAVRPRHDLAGMRSGYVVPTTKKRDALVWDVRKGIATSI
jgi:hypothetical protein